MNGWNQHCLRLIEQFEGKLQRNTSAFPTKEGLLSCGALVERREDEIRCKNMDLVRQTIDLIGCIGLAALAVMMIVARLGLVRAGRQMHRLT